MIEFSPSLVRRAVEGDPAATRELVAQLRPVIQARVARALLRSGRRAAGRAIRQEVEDLTQQVFLSLFADGGRVLLQWDPERGLGLLGYVGLVAERDLTSILRSRRRHPWTEEPIADEDMALGADPGVSPEIEVASRETLRAVLEAMQRRLTDRGKILFQLLVVEEQPIEHICAALEMTPDAVYAWRSRLGRLAREIAQEIASGPGSEPRSTLETPR